MFLPGLTKNLSFVNSSPTLASFNMTTTGHKLCWAFCAERAMTITKLGFRYGTTSGVPPTYKISLRAMSLASPYSTILGGASPASATFTPPSGTSWNNTYQVITLDNSYTCTMGEFLGIVLEYDSNLTAPISSNYSSFVYGDNAFYNKMLPVAYTNTGASYSSQVLTPIFSYHSDTTIYGMPVLTNSSTLSTSGNTKIGIKVNVPSGTCTSYKIAGLQFKLSSGDTGGDTFYVRLWDSSETVLQSLTWDTDKTGNGSGTYQLWFDKSSLVSLSPNTDYYLGIEYVSGTHMAFICIDAVDSDSALSINRNGPNVAYGATISAGTLTDTKIPMFTPIITDLA